MIVLDRMLVGGIRFVLDKVASAVESELNDEDRIREELLSAQMRHELGEMPDEEFASLESALLARLRVIREERMGPTAPVGTMKVTGAEAEFLADEEHGGEN